MASDLCENRPEVGKPNRDRASRAPGYPAPGATGAGRLAGRSKDHGGTRALKFERSQAPRLFEAVGSLHQRAHETQF